MSIGADLFKLDCDELLRELGDGSVDLIVTDPAYESLEKHRAVGTTTRLRVSDASSNEWFPIYRNERLPRWFAECARVLGKDRHMYVFCDVPTMRVAVPCAERAGLTFWNAVVWHKTGGMGMGYHYRRSYELVLFFEKGKRRLRDLGVPDLLPFPRVRGGYPTEKPLDLCRLLVTQSTERGELVFDPFMGSGTSLVAALLEGRSAAGCDVSEDAFVRTMARISREAPGVDVQAWRRGDAGLGLAAPTPYELAGAPPLSCRASGLRWRAARQLDIGDAAQEGPEVLTAEMETELRVAVLGGHAREMSPRHRSAVRALLSALDAARGHLTPCGEEGV